MTVPASVPASQPIAPLAGVLGADPIALLEEVQEQTVARLEDVRFHWEMSNWALLGAVQLVGFVFALGGFTAGLLAYDEVLVVWAVTAGVLLVSGVGVRVGVGLAEHVHERAGTCFMRAVANRPPHPSTDTL